MRIETYRKLFVGVRIDNKMRDQLEKCPQRDRVFFEAEDGRYLTIVRGGEEAYIGKVLEGATPIVALDDVRRNVLSILNRICPGRRDQDDVKILATDEGEPPPPRRRDSGGHAAGGMDRGPDYY
jgi:hypothetical protein